MDLDGAAERFRAEAASVLKRDGFAHFGPEMTTPALEAAGLADWDGFAASWERLEPDRFMADGGRYRRRRHAVFALSASSGSMMIERLADQPHRQSVEHNRLNGGVDRWFAPLEPAVGAHPVMRAVLGTAFELFDPLGLPGAAGAGSGRPARWLAEVHQFRIEATGAEKGEPTPEGAHRDGVDWVLVMMVGRRRVSAGETSVFDAASGRGLGSFTLRDPRELVLVDDARCLHGVTAVQAVNGGLSGFRDVLVVTLKGE